ncbi:MAG: biotin/lipoyl-containing protein [Spirochaetota bacterium]
MALETAIEKKDGNYYKITKYFTSHTGSVSIKAEEGQVVEEGDLLYTLTRLGLIKKRLVETPGVVTNINKNIEGRFCGYYTHVLDVQHKLTPEEVQALEEEEDYIFVTAPQGAQYFITSEPGMPPLVNVGDIVDKGSVLAVAMVMKKRREIIYHGERGKIARMYFMNGQQCHQGDKLFGIIPRPIKKD